MKRLLGVTFILVLLAMVCLCLPALAVYGNEGVGTATQLTLNQVYTSHLEDRYDEDFYHFSLSSAGVVTVSFKHDYVEKTDDLWEMFLQTKSGDVFLDYFYEGNNDKEVITHEMGLPAGDYYIRIKTCYSTGAGANNYSFAPYQIKANFTASEYWETEFNDSMLTSDPIKPDTYYSGSMRDEHDVDYFEFTLTANTEIDVSFRHAYVNKSENLWALTVCSRDGTEFCTLKYSGTYDKENVSDPIALQAGTYYVRIKSCYAIGAARFNYALETYQFGINTVAERKSAYDDVRAMIAAGKDSYSYGLMYALGNPAIVRKEPKASATIIETYSNGAMVYNCYWSKDDGEFIHVMYGDLDGYIYAGELSIAEEAYRGKACLVSRKISLEKMMMIPDLVLDTTVGSVRLVARSAEINEGVICWVGAYSGNSSTPSWGWMNVSNINTDPVDTMDVFIGGTESSRQVLLYSVARGLSAVDFASGKLLWENDWTSDGIVHAVGPDGTIYVQGVYGTPITAIDVGGKNKWRQEFKDYPIGVWPVKIDLKEDEIHLTCERGNGAVIDYKGNILRIIPMDDEDLGVWVTEEHWMYYDCNPNRIYFTLDGVMLKGWQTFDEKTYYFTSKGELVTGKTVIDGEEYEFDDKGVLTAVVRDGVKYRIEKGKASVAGLANTNVKSLSIPTAIRINRKNYKITAILANAFAGQKKLTAADIGKNVATIGENAFSGCTKLQNVSGMAGVTEIGAGAFENCSALTKFTLESKVKRIGAKAFRKCKKIKTFTIKTTKLTESTVGEDAFAIGVKATYKCPKEKRKAYKKLLLQKGAHKKSKFK